MIVWIPKLVRIGINLILYRIHRILKSKIVPIAGVIVTVATFLVGIAGLYLSDTVTSVAIMACALLVIQITRDPIRVYLRFMALNSGSTGSQQFMLTVLDFGQSIAKVVLSAIAVYALSVTSLANLAATPHPAVFGDRMANGLITTDFGEAQIELRTHPCDCVKQCYDKLREITNVVLCELSGRDELMWPYSMPCKLPQVEDFKFNDYAGYPEEAEYEAYLYEKYGYRMHCISGIHLNFSIDEDFLADIAERANVPDNLDDAYFMLVRNFRERPGLTTE